MSEATVRSALTSYFQGASITGLVKVCPAVPYWADGSAWQLGNSSTASSAIAAVHLVKSQESRLTVPALTGVKMITYDVALMVFYQWLLPSGAIGAAGDESDWNAPLDVIIDGLKSWIRADPNCGMPSVIWQSGQDPQDIKVQRDLPRFDAEGGKVLSWNVVEFTVYEHITA